jgi:rhomboid protease GluP
MNPVEKFDSLTLVHKLIFVNVVVFVVALLIDTTTDNFRLDLFGFLSPSPAVLIKIGAAGVIPSSVDHRWWTLVSANYIHIGAFHLIVNMYALNTLGKITVSMYGPSRMLIIYTFGGALSMYASCLAQISLTAGASGAICALIGAIIYGDWREGGRSAKSMLSSFGIWAAVLIVIGFVMPNVNNWAHAAGLIVGLPIGMLLWRERKAGQDDSLCQFLAASCAAATVGSFFFALTS